MLYTNIWALLYHRIKLTYRKIQVLHFDNMSLCLIFNIEIQNYVGNLLRIIFNVIHKLLLFFVMLIVFFYYRVSSHNDIQGSREEEKTSRLNRRSRTNLEKEEQIQCVMLIYLMPRFKLSKAARVHQKEIQHFFRGIWTTRQKVDYRQIMHI